MKVCAQRYVWVCGTVAACAVMLLVGACRKTTDAAVHSKSHNVLLITLDTTRADRLGCYGYSRETSPHLDALAKDSVRFDFAIAQAAVTPVSHASILTGLNPYAHGVRVIYAASGYRLKDSVDTLATVLRDHGWRTGAFLSSFTVSELYGFDRGFDTFDNGLADPTDNVLKPRSDGAWMWDIHSNQRRSDETTDRAIAWLKGGRTPFFAWVHYWDPHDVFLIPPTKVIKRFVVRQPSHDMELRALYDAEIFYMDAQLGRLLKAIEEMGEYNNTIIVVVADHGEGLGDHGFWYHRILYQEQIRVPMIIRVPDDPAGRVVPQLVNTIDIYPTVLETLGIAPPKPVEGQSLCGLMKGRPEPPRIAYADALNLFDLNAVLLKDRPNDDLLYCAMDRSWKLIYRPKRRHLSELYHLDMDPDEGQNLYDPSNEHASRLMAALERFDGFVDQPFGPTTDPTVLKRLRSLGYVGDADDKGHRPAPPNP